MQKNVNWFRRLIIVLLILSPMFVYFTYSSYVDYSSYKYNEAIRELKNKNQDLYSENDRLKYRIENYTKAGIKSMQDLKGSLDKEKVKYEILFLDQSILLRLPAGVRGEGVQYQLELCTGETRYKKTVY